MGANGSGKTTLLKMIAGETAPDAGTVTVGASVKMAYFAQHAMELLDPADTVWDSLQKAFPRASVGSLRTLAGCFGFSGDEIEKVEPPKVRKVVDFEFRQAPRSGEDVVRLAGVAKRWGSRTVYDGLDLLVRRGERWCVLGANGAGKSTLLKLVAGATAPDAGTVTVGASVRMGYFAQHAMELLDEEATVWETLQDAFPRASVGSLRTLAGCFGFSGDEIEKRCRVLSGGEKARLVLARLLYDPPNFLVLDEPTNHLDVATKEMLVRALAGFDGTMLFVSHDRRFLAALSNRVLELGPGGPVAYGGGYVEYVARTGREAPGLREPARRV
jgi:ATPase subunit of ABC transporter with duplicated ATPase domains